MQERNGVTRFNGNPVTLIGPEVTIGSKAPGFRVIDNDLQLVTLDDFKGKTKIICTVPSLDTPVCDAEIRRFNQEAVTFKSGIVVLTISMDLPFAQKRWCTGAGIERVKTLSDYQELSFAASYGVLVKELKLLSRSIFVIDTEDVVRYIQHVSEMTDEPDYSAALAALICISKQNQCPARVPAGRIYLGT